MGLCTSCESGVDTAKVILHDGRLEEFSYPVKVSFVLQKNPACFLCNSDEMDFNDLISAVSDDEELQPGQLYFVLPLSRLERRLQAEEMAALAVKASSALNQSGGHCGDKCGCRRKVIACSGEEGRKRSRKVADDGGAGSRRRSGGGGQRRGKFTAMLTAIPE